MNEMCCNGPVIFFKIDPDHKRLTSKEEIRWILSDEKKNDANTNKTPQDFYLLWTLMNTCWILIMNSFYHLSYGYFKICEDF